MKTNITKTLLAMAVCFVTLACHGQTNREARVTYVLSNLGISREQQKKLKPMLYAYLEEKKEANGDYDALKEKMKSQIKAETITASQAEKLLTAKWAAEAKELAAKKKWAAEFKTVINAPKTYKAFDLLNDKKSKISVKLNGKNSPDGY